MFQNRTVIIVGAGASFEAGMPVGTKLAEKIALAAGVVSGRKRNMGERLEELAHALKDNTAPNDRGALQKAAIKIEEGIHLAGSIDAFIDRHSNDEHVGRLGKALIASEILDAEAHSKMAVRADGGIFDTIDLVPTWYHSFASLLFSGFRAGDLDGIASNIVIVCFNYDRCIEHYLLRALMQSFSLSYGEAHRLMCKIPVIHPYGHIGKLPAGEHGTGMGVTPFGARQERLYQNPFEFSASIRTFTEQEHDLQRQQSIHEALRAADRVVFLGFSFQPQNMELLRLPTRSLGERMKEVFATGVGISKEDSGAVEQSIAEIFWPSGGSKMARSRIKLHLETTCVALFDKYRLVFMTT